MKNDNLIELLQSGNVVIPIYLLKNYKKLNIEIDQFVFLMYLVNLRDSVFNPKSIGNELDIKNTEVMNYIGILSDKKLVSIDTKKVDKNIVDVINLDGFYSQLSGIVKEKVNAKDVDNSSVFELIEKEFGRTLSSMEYEIIKAWRDSNISDELITEALREAVLNGVNNLKYIDKILYEWGKKGIKTAKDVEDNRKKRRAQMEKNKDTDSDVDLGVLDGWLDDE